MIINLFSIFDPSISLFSLSWLILFFAILFIPTITWKFSSPFLKLFKFVVSMFIKEVVFTLGKKEKGRLTIIISVFRLILIMNFLALYPQIFSTTSHLTITLPLSLCFWLSLILFGWLNNTSSMLTHLVPVGTPTALINFMVLIEFVRNIIRPITLCVRLTANLIAGHLLISLLGNAISSFSLRLRFLFVLAPIILTILESAVACIQAYVFITLITLYTTEVK